jgi:hypothetical protein
MWPSSAGTDGDENPNGFLICQTTVGSDMTVFANQLGVSLNIGDIGTGCSPNSIGRDLHVVDNSVEADDGPGTIDIGDNRIGRDMVLNFDIAGSRFDRR